MNIENLNSKEVNQAVSDCMKDIMEVIESYFQQREYERGYSNIYGNLHSRSYLYILRHKDTGKLTFEHFNERCIPEWFDVIEVIDSEDYDYISKTVLGYV